MTTIAGVPISVLTDSYKATHFLQYPSASKMVAYGEFRSGYNKDRSDTRFVSYGIRYMIDNYIAKQWTMEDVERASLFFSTHMAPMYTEFPFPKEMFAKFVNENNELGKDSPLIPSRLQDFGFRGCTSVEQSIIGGCAHLLSFSGSDTMSAAYYAQFNLNGGRPVANSIPATEHSVMTAWPTEQEAIENMIKHFGHGTFACVMGSHGYAKVL
eukprot:gene2407-8718_t